MRKIGIVLAILLMIGCFGNVLPAAAASAMHADAKAADPVLDGVVGEDEYGNPFVINAQNSSEWGEWGPLHTSVVYHFAWSNKGLYIAMTYLDSLVGDESLLQFVCNPGGQIQGSQEGLFFTIYPTYEVTLHNHKTQAGDASNGACDISRYVNITSKTLNGYTTMEVLLPIQAFRITNSNFNFSAGSMSASAVVMLHYQGVYTVGAAVSSHLEGWDLRTIGLGTLTLLPKTQTTPNVPPAPDTNPGVDPDFGVDVDPDFGVDLDDFWNDFGDFGDGDFDFGDDDDDDFKEDMNHGGRAIFYVAGIFAIAYAILGVLVTILAITLLIVLCVRKHKRKKGK